MRKHELLALRYRNAVSVQVHTYTQELHDMRKRGLVHFHCATMPAHVRTQT